MSKEAQDPVITIALPPGAIPFNEAETGHVYSAIKTYNHSIGLSCVFRQPKATHSHCQYLHGYALKVEIEFQARILDDKNWVQDFGGLKPFKTWLENTFDHKCLVAADDPKISIFRELHIAGLIQLVIVPAVGIEAFARMIYEQAVFELERHPIDVTRVRVWEHDGNSAQYGVI